MNGLPVQHGGFGPPYQGGQPPMIPPRPPVGAQPPPPPPTGCVQPNQIMFQGFEWYVPADHQHWRRLEKALPSLAALGVTSMWIPPACKASWFTGNGYDIYDLFDLGEFDQKGARHTKWGTREELVAMAEYAGRYGIRILFDAVLNHKAAADYSEEVTATKYEGEGEFLRTCGRKWGRVGGGVSSPPPENGLWAQFAEIGPKIEPASARNRV
jgi:alpha-amylase